VAGSCTLRDTFFGHPVSVCTGRAKTLSHRAQAGYAPRRPARPAKPAVANIPARACGLRMPAPASRLATRSVAGSCTLRDTFFGHPVSVCTGRAKTLSHRAQAGYAPRRPARPAKPAVANIPARACGLRMPARASRLAVRSVTGSCPLPDTFFGHPVSVCTGRAKTLSHRAQVGDAPRRPARPAKPAVANIPARACGLRMPAPASWLAVRSVTGSCPLRDTFFGHPVSVCTGRAKTLSRRAQAGYAPRRPARPATGRTLS